ncbi:MAG: alpha/beta hydrolase [Solirubrobacterales bacterium]
MPSRRHCRRAAHRVAAIAALAAALAALNASAATAAPGPQPGTPEYIQRDNQNILDAYGRQTAPGGQLQNPNYLLSLNQAGLGVGLQQLLQQVATPNRLAITPGNVFGGWNVGNPLREGWDGRRGTIEPIAYTNRYGAFIRGDVFAPLPGARDPYTGRKLAPPYPGVVITTGSIQGSERMYWWLAQDLAERGYVVLTYDVQGQGTSETLPHQNDQVNALPFCNPFAPPEPAEQFGCPGVPSQQEANFIYGTQDALDFFLSTPDDPYPNPNGSDAPVDDFNPFWALFDRSRDGRTATPGRTTRVAIVGHSLGAAAISYVQGVDERVAAAVALDKLSASGSFIQDQPVTPVVPALAVQSEYGFNVAPYWMQNGSSVQPQPGPPDQGPDPQREALTGFDAWRGAGVDSMLIVPRASTHLEYTDIPLVLPASRFGQALTSLYVQAWLDRYLKHQSGAFGRLLAERFTYLEPTGQRRWEPVTLERAKQLSFYYCSGYDIRSAGGSRLVEPDIAGVGCE